MTQEGSHRFDKDMGTNIQRWNEDIDSVRPLKILLTYHWLALNMMELQFEINIQHAQPCDRYRSVWTSRSWHQMSSCGLVCQVNWWKWWYGAAECSTDSSVWTQVKYRHAHPAGNYKRAPHSSLTLLAIVLPALVAHDEGADPNSKLMELD